MGFLVEAGGESFMFSTRIPLLLLLQRDLLADTLVLKKQHTSTLAKHLLNCAIFHADNIISIHHERYP